VDASVCFPGEDFGGSEKQILCLSLNREFLFPGSSSASAIAFHEWQIRIAVPRTVDGGPSGDRPTDRKRLKNNSLCKTSFATGVDISAVRACVPSQE
jgi:hypothetical protein